MKLRSLSSLLFFGLSSCFFFDHPVAGGGSDQPNEIAGTLQGPGGQSLARTHVYLYRQIDSASVLGFKPIDSTTTDSSGKYTLLADSSGAKYGIYAMHGEHSLFGLRKNILVNNKNINIAPMTLSKGVTLKGSLNSNGWVQIDTLPIVFGGHTGDFTFVVPSGQKIELFSQNAKSIPNSHLTDFIAWEGDTVVVGALSPQSNGSEILIDNFEDGDLRTLIGRYFSGGWWYGDASAGTASISTINESAVVQTDSTKALHATATVLDPDFPIRYAVLGFNIGAGVQGCPQNQGSCFFNLAKAQSISFRAKGNGTVRMQIGTKAVSDLKDYNFPYQEITIDNRWRTFVVPLNQLQINPSSPASLKGITLSDMLKGSYAVSFLMMNDMDLWIDDIKINGLGLGDLEITH